MNILFSSCRKTDTACDFNGKYEFELPAELSPRQDTFKVGDTISVVSEFSNEVYERKTQSKYKLVDFHFYPRIGFVQLDTLPAFLSLNGFILKAEAKYDLQVSIHSAGTSRMLAHYIYSDGKYLLKYKIVPNKPGLYMFTQSSSLYPQEEGQNFPGKCGGKTSSAYVKLNNSIGNNFHFLYNTPDTSFLEIIIKDPQLKFYDGGGYCFYVVDK